MFCRPNSLMISRSLLCLLAVLFLAISCLLQFISGRLKSPVMSTFGVFCVLYSFVRDSGLQYYMCNISNAICKT